MGGRQPPASEKLFKSDPWPSLGEVQYPPLTVHHGSWNPKKLARNFGRVCCCSASRKSGRVQTTLSTFGLLHSKKIVPDQTHILGRFLFEWSGNDVNRPTLSIRSLESSSSDGSGGGEANARMVWSSTPGGSFVAASSVSLDIFEERGSIDVAENSGRMYSNQSVKSIEREGDGGGNMLTIRGRLCDKGTFGEDSPRYSLTFCVCRTNPRAIAYQVDVAFSSDDDENDGAPVVNQAHFIGSSDGDEALFGFGAQFTHVNCKGYEIPVVAEEGGIGRGDGGTPRLLRFLGVEGESSSSYCPSPHLLSQRGRSLFLVDYEPSVFDLRAEEWFSVRVNSSRMRGCILDGRDPLDSVELFTSFVGRMPPLPEWVHGGAIVGMQGGTDRVRQVWSDLQRHEVPISGFWLQDWVGQRKTAIGKQLWWNWVLDEDRYPGWDGMVEDLEEEGIKVGVYVNPFLVDVPARQLNGRRNLYREALGQGYLVRDQRGRLYSVPNTDFSAAVLDLSNEKARRWFLDVLKTEVVEKSGAKFWMADFGEAAQFDGMYTSGESGLTYHNKYPVEWAKLNREAIARAGKEGEAWFFARSGFLNTPAYSTAMWTGDQNVTWGARDGLPSSVAGLLSGGFSGLSINHSDVGGYTSVSNPVLRAFGRGFVRSHELLERWMEINAFTAIFRTHEGNEPDKNVQFYTDESTLEAFARWSKVYAALGKYRKKLMKEASERGYPVVRHPIMHYPYDANLYDRTVSGYSFMLGHLVFVCPVVKPGVTRKIAYLPAGRWVHLWSKETYGDPNRGVSVEVDAPLGRPPVFYVDCDEATRLIATKVTKTGIFPAM